MRIWWKLVYKRLFVSNLNDVLLSSGWPLRAQHQSAINFMPIAKRILRHKKLKKINKVLIELKLIIFIHLYFLVFKPNQTNQSWGSEPNNFHKKVLILVNIFTIYFAILLQHCMDDIWEMCFLSAPGCCGGWSQNVIVYTEAGPSQREEQRRGCLG